MLAVPGLVLAVAGLFHPHHLSYDTSWRWFALHVPGLLVFPLVGLALAELVHDRRDAAAWAIRVTAYGYATFYTALDVVSGIAAGYVTHELGPGVPRPESVSLLFRVGTPLGHVGSLALIACCALVTLDLVVRRRAWPALILVPGAVLVHVGHIFAPTGVAGMLLLGVGTAATAWSARRGNHPEAHSVIVV
jgi:hypothetical protein